LIFQLDAVTWQTLHILTTCELKYTL